MADILIGLLQAAFFGIVVLGLRNLRVWVGPLPDVVCQAHSLMTKMTLSFALCVVVVITIARFFYIGKSNFYFKISPLDGDKGHYNG